MRDIKRIKRILNRMEVVWTKHSDLRFGQLIDNIDNCDLFYLEDDDLENLLNKYE